MTEFPSSTVDSYLHHGHPFMLMQHDSANQRVLLNKCRQCDSAHERIDVRHANCPVRCRDRSRERKKLDIECKHSDDDYSEQTQ